VRFDCDILLHRYFMPGDKKGIRDLQCLMFIEAKTQGASLTPAQQDTLSMFNQALRNRRPNIYRKKRGRHLKDHCPPALAYSHLLKDDVRLWMYGGHLLRMNNDAPDTSTWIEWDYQKIDVPTLLQLMKFEIDPDSLQPIDWRRRYSDFKGEKEQLRLPFD